MGHWVDVPAIALEDGRLQAPFRHYVEDRPVKDPEPYTESEILARFKWTSEQFRQARELLKWPASCGRDVKGLRVINSLTARANTPGERLYRRHDVDRVFEDLRALGFAFTPKRCI